MTGIKAHTKIQSLRLKMDVIRTRNHGHFPRAVITRDCQENCDHLCLEQTMAESRAMASQAQQLQLQLADHARRSSVSGVAWNGGAVVHVPARRRARSVVVAASKEGEAKKDPRRPSEGIFSFVTDNDSSRNAIQLPNAPAMDGNTGQMIAQIENKGRDYGSYVRAGEFRWFVRETGTPDARNGTVVFLHGAPTQSYSYRVVMAQMAKEGYHCYAPDWLGFGFSEKPQPEYDFSYTEEAYHEELDKLIAKLDIPSPFYLVTQGFIVGSYGLTWALKNPSRVKKLVAMNTPLTPSAPLPGIFQQLRFPLVGEFTCQNAILPERFVEAGSPYVLELDDADVYRLPYLDSSDPGFSLLAAARKAPLKDLTSRIAQGFASPNWKVPTTVAWGMSDKHLPKSEAENFVKSNPGVLKATMLDGAGHLPQEDWPEKVVEALSRFFY